MIDEKYFRVFDSSSGGKLIMIRVPESNSSNDNILVFKAFKGEHGYRGFIIKPESTLDKFNFNIEGRFSNKKAIGAVNEVISKSIFENNKN